MELRKKRACMTALKAFSVVGSCSAGTELLVMLMPVFAVKTLPTVRQKRVNVKCPAHGPENNSNLDLAPASSVVDEGSLLLAPVSWRHGGSCHAMLLLGALRSRGPHHRQGTRPAQHNSISLPHCCFVRRHRQQHENSTNKPVPYARSVRQHCKAHLRGLRCASDLRSRLQCAFVPKSDTPENC